MNPIPRVGKKGAQPLMARAKTEAMMTISSIESCLFRKGTFAA
jgi:hypothetical protein